MQPLSQDRGVAEMGDLADITQQPRSAHPYKNQSPEITDQDDVATFAASRQSQLPTVMRPLKVENLSRLKIRNLFRRSAAQFLAPDVSDAVPG